MKSLSLLVALCFAMACTPRELPAAHGPLPFDSPSAEEHEVGAARVDITPPPGLSLFGHGPGSRVAVGYWTRLYCRAFYIESRAHQSGGVALVSCDLPQISLLLTRRVAELVCPPVHAARLVLTATHTHAGPGHFFGNQNYGGLATSHYPGFDPDVVEFLATRIAAAIKQARDARRLARTRWIVEPDALWGLARNRSLEPYLLNDPPFARTPPPGLDLSAAERAIDPTLRVLQFEAVGERTVVRSTPEGPVEVKERGPIGPIGSIAFVGMHPTVLRASNRLYNGDVFGVATRAVERELRRRWTDDEPRIKECEASGYPAAQCAAVPRPDPVVAIMNTNEGDISPIWAESSLEEVVEIGLSLGERIHATHPADTIASSTDGSFRDRIVVDNRYVEVDLPNAHVPALPGYTERRLCDRGGLGVGATRGGSDHPTFLDPLLPASETSTDYTPACQAPKRPFLPFVQGLLGEGAFPRRVPLNLVRIGDTFISFVPAELTITAGARVNAAVLRGAGIPRADAVVGGLANEYIQYVATREEYGMQRYEGASTLYGPSTAELLAQRFEYLARHLVGQDVRPALAKMGDHRLNEAGRFEYSPAERRERLWKRSFDAKLEDLETDRGPLGMCRVGGPKPEEICFYWVDAGPASTGLTLEPWIGLVLDRPGRPPARTCGRPFSVDSIVPAACDYDATIDDTGWNFSTRVVRRKGDAWIWSTVYRPSEEEWLVLANSGAVRFRARQPLPHSSVESAPFSALAPPPACTARQLAEYCR